MEYKKIVLKNGLRVILVPKQSTEVITAIAMVGVGSRYESDRIAGISHVLEHMHFKGTEKRPTAFSISAFVDSLGAEYNAFTGKESTGYYIKVTPKHLYEALDYLSDILLHSKIDAGELEKEKQVIVSEINMYEDLPMEVVGSKFEEALFGNNDLGREIIGTKESVKGVSRKDLVNYKALHYTAANSVLVLAGNLGQHSEKELIEKIEEYFSLPIPTEISKEELILNRKKALSIVRRKTEQSHLIIGFQTVPITSPDYYTLDLLALILGGSMSSRMFEEIREKRGLAYAVKTSTTNYLESGLLETQAGVHHEKIYEAIEAILGEYRKIKNEKVGEDELAKAKEIISGRLLIKFEDSEELSTYYALDEILLNKIVTPAEALKIYQNITADDIIKAANKYLTEDRMALSFVGPEIEERKLKKLFTL